MTEVPLFPLNAVVFPGMATGLHIFEDRYRELVSELLSVESAFDRVFGIIAIREGYEVGDHGMQAAHRVGTLVQLTEAEPYEDGRYDIEVIGRQRILVVDSRATPGSFLRGTIELLAEDEPPRATRAAQRAAELALATFEQYRLELSDLRGGPVLSGELPTDPAYLSYALAATCLLTLSQRQALLEADSSTERLAMLRLALHEEMRAMRALPSLPATEVARTRWSPN